MQFSPNIYLSVKEFASGKPKSDLMKYERTIEGKQYHFTDLLDLTIQRCQLCCGQEESREETGFE
jgi:hypothetical protein